MNVSISIFSKWGDLNLEGLYVTLTSLALCSEWGITQSESIYLVEEGEGSVLLRGKTYPIQKGYAFKLFPGQDPEIVPEGSLSLTAVQKTVESDNTDSWRE